MTLDVARIRKDFPILDRTVRGGRPLIYLDSANTSQKPRQVIDALTEFYERHNANIHRANHELGEEATEAYEGARIKAAQFIGAADETEVIFTKNISEGINLVAYSMGNASAGSAGPDRFRLGPGDEIVVTEMEHHSNIVPWQLLCGRRELLDEMPPFLGGGEMIETVWMERSTYAPPPHKFEAGTMPIAQAVGLAAAMDYLNEIGRDAIHAHEQQLLGHALTKLADIDGLRILGPTTPEARGPALSLRVCG